MEDVANTCCWPLHLFYQGDFLNREDLICSRRPMECLQKREFSPGPTPLIKAVVVQKSFTQHKKNENRIFSVFRDPHNALVVVLNQNIQETAPGTDVALIASTDLSSPAFWLFYYKPVKLLLRAITWFKNTIWTASVEFGNPLIPTNDSKGNNVMKARGLMPLKTTTSAPEEVFQHSNRLNLIQI